MINRILQVFGEKSPNNKSNFARRIGMGNRTVNDILNERTAPSVDFLVHILNAYPDISAEWLMRGTGDMFIGKPKTAQQTQNVSDLGGIVFLMNKIGKENEELKAENSILKAKLNQRGKAVV